MKKSIWLSYDLRVGGDYAGLYQWLDGLDAVECVNDLAYFKIDIDGDEDVAEKIEAEIRKNVEIGKNDRYYIVYRKPDNKIGGKYIIGNRKANPWAGYKVRPAEEDVE